MLIAPTSRRSIAIGLLGSALLLVSCVAFSQSPDGPSHVFHDDLLDHLAGKWQLTGQIAGRKATHQVEAEWVLNHQFLRIHERDSAPAVNGNSPYEAMVFVGRDDMSERYVAHWMDIFGGRWSETLGYGTRTGDAIDFVFEYPDGPFHTTFRWVEDKKQWEWKMRSHEKNGGWSDFGLMQLAPQ